MLNPCDQPSHRYNARSLGGRHSDSRSGLTPPNLRCRCALIAFWVGCLSLGSPFQGQAIDVAPLTRSPQVAQLATDDYFERASYYFEHGSLQSALSYYSRVLSLDPSYAEAYNNRANAHADLRQYPEAIADFSEALNYAHPDLGLIYYNRGNTYLEMGRYDEAIADFSDAIQQNYSRIALAYYNRGNANLFLRRYYSAIDDFNQAISHDPGYVEAYNNRGSTQVYLENFADAINDYSTAIDLEQTSPTSSKTLEQAYYNRANVYYQLGDHSRAVADYTAALTLNLPDLPSDQAQRADVLYGRALAYMFLGHRPEALIDLDQAIELYNQTGNVEWYQNTQMLRDRWQ
ncbi:MAG: tetratricopeptide repeat protein [Oscillatoriales cyanobacterium]|nr:MAG: tetratricopeptide repeat protein [Oscillatoriales cyanobacterium]